MSFSWMYGNTVQTRCNIMSHTSLNLDESLIETMNQKLNYYKALQIAASLTPRVEARAYLNE